ncbi:Transposable element Tc3 transposase [Cucumispora dikerogammari]|nr:Transposable element Tc3 transposase [Cucumispora dikerogammari]
MTDIVRRTNRTTNNRLREELIKKHTIEGYSIKEAALLTNVSYEAARKIISIYNTTQRVNRKKTGGANNTKIIREGEVFIENEIEKNPQITLDQIKNKLFQELQIMVSLETIRRVIFKLKITLKKASRTLENVNSTISKEKRQEYARRFLTEDTIGQSIKVFIDESGFNLHMRRTMARSTRGAPASLVLPSVRGRNVSLISAITRNEVLYSICVVGAVNSDRYKEFFEGLINKCTEKNIIGKCVFVMDNARIHNSHNIRDFYGVNNLSIQFLAPYSYMLNPIEFGFSKIKACVRRKLAEGFTGSFENLILESVNELTETDLRGYYSHILRNCLKAVEMENFN